MRSRIEAVRDGRGPQDATSAPTASRTAPTTLTNAIAIAIVTGNGFDLFYRAGVAASAYLGGLDSALTGGGTLRAVPEADALALTGLGLFGLGAATLRQQSA